MRTDARKTTSTSIFLFRREGSFSPECLDVLPTPKSFFVPYVCSMGCIVSTSLKPSPQPRTLLYNMSVFSGVKGVHTYIYIYIILESSKRGHRPQAGRSTTEMEPEHSSDTTRALHAHPTGDFFCKNHTLCKMTQIEGIIRFRLPPCKRSKSSKTRPQL